MTIPRVNVSKKNEAKVKKELRVKFPRKNKETLKELSEGVKIYF